MQNRNKYLLLSLILLNSCEGFLDEKPKSNLLIPNKVQDLEQLMDATTWGINNTPAILEISTDNLYTSEQGYLGLSILERNAYTWQKDLYEFNGSDWDSPYYQILVANVVLDEAEKLSPDDQDEGGLLIELRGRALWMRSQAYFQLLSAFAAPYDPNGANDSPGVPLRLSPQVGQVVMRGTIGEDYAQITSDLEKAVSMLPELAEFKTRPSKLSAHALLARIYLAMEVYDKAEFHASEALEIDNSLMNYWELDATRQYPFLLFNEEVIHHLQMLNYSHMNSGLTFVDSALVKEYAEDDLRKELLFTKAAQAINFDGNYSGSRVRFSGLATNEMYLIAAECAARRGDVNGSMGILNSLLETRWKEGAFIPFTASDSEVALSLILQERRKELIFRGIRWMDLRRLNRDPRFAKVLSRKVGVETFEIGPESPRYVLPIPPDEILVSGIAQNPR
jgi:tetratricopeptide (TPR) repeat protein